MSETMRGIRGRVLAELDKWMPDLRDALAAREPADVDAVLADTRERLVGILEGTPDPGWRAAHMRAFTIGGMIYVAFYLALASRGWDAARVWELCEAATKTHFARMSGFEKKLASDGMFGWPMRALSRWVAKRSQRAPVGGWVMRFVEGEPGAFDFGVDYERCAIREMAVANGAAELAPYICLADIAGSEAFGWGLERKETLAQGGQRCDFRFRRGGETQVRVHLPVV
jgi:hypothetical protein